MAARFIESPDGVRPTAVIGILVMTLRIGQWQLPGRGYVGCLSRSGVDQRPSLGFAAVPAAPTLPVIAASRIGDEREKAFDKIQSDHRTFPFGRAIRASNSGKTGAMGTVRQSRHPDKEPHPRRTPPCTSG